MVGIVGLGYVGLPLVVGLRSVQPEALETTTFLRTTRERLR